MKALKIILIILLPILIGCQREYIDSPLTEHKWQIAQVQEKDGFGWADAEQYYPIANIRFFKDYSIELMYKGDTTVYLGDWTEYFKNVNCPDGNCSDLHLLLVNLYHESPLPTVFEVRKLNSHRLRLVSDEPGFEVRFDFEN